MTVSLALETIPRQIDRRVLGTGSLKILQIVSGLEINGAVVYCKLLTQQLIARGHQVVVLCRPQSWASQQSLGCEIIESDLKRTPGRLRQIAALIRNRNIDIIHTHMSRANAFGSLLKALVRTPVVKTAHSQSFQLHWQVNDFVIANSKSTEKYHRRTNRIPAHKIQTLHCIVDSQAIENVTRKSERTVRGQLRWRNGEFLVGIVGQVIARKGHRFLVESLPQLTREIPNLRVVIVGRFHRREAYVKKLRGFLNENGIHRKTRWIGIRENVPDFISAMDVCVVPSLAEPLGLVAIEAQALGTPVVASRTGGLCEIIEHEKTGLLIPPSNAEAIAESIIRIHDDETLRKKIIHHGKIQYREEFDPAEHVEQVEQLYANLCSTRKAA